MKTIDTNVLSNVLGGGFGALVKPALISKEGGGGWITLDRGRPKVTPGVGADIVSGKFTTAPWDGSAAVTRPYSAAVPHGATSDADVRILKPAL